LKKLVDKTCNLGLSPMATIEHVQSKNQSLSKVNYPGGGEDTVRVKNGQSTTKNYNQTGRAREIISESSSDEEILLTGIGQRKSACSGERTDETPDKSAPAVSVVNPVSLQVNSQNEEDDDLIKVEKPSSEIDKPSLKSKISKKKKVSSSKRSKKTYDKPGQKKDTPGELDGGRIFYESLRKQNPKSKIAEDYLLKHGLLTYDEATAIVALQQKTKTNPTSKTGVVRKVPSISKTKKNKSKTDKKKNDVKKRKAVRKT